MNYTLPNLLTWLRIVAIPLLVLVYAWPDAAIGVGLRNIAATVLFVGAAITDALDGWLARRMGQTSSFGEFFDPVADKLIVCAALIVLLELDRVSGLVALVIIGREIAISALREWMASIGARRSVAVQSIGKLKTILQLVAIPMLLYDGELFGLDFREIGTWGIVIAAGLTVWSMLVYLRAAWPFLKDGAS